MKKVPMKKHEACHHLNCILKEKRDRLAELKKEEHSTTKFDPETKQQVPVTAEDLARYQRWNEERIAELTHEIEALDIAASSLTR